MRFLFILTIILFSACQTVPKAAPEQPEIIQEEEPIIVISEEPEIAEPTTSYGVSQELYDQTLAEVRIFIENLNKIIAAKNFNGWRTALTDERFNILSSAQFLREQSESPALKLRNKVLRNVNDYFLEVVVPARANSKADEIEFIEETNVKVFYLETRSRRNENNEMVAETRRLQLYELTKSADGWKITS